LGLDALYDRVEFNYNRQGERILKKTQNGTVHRYVYDNFGRILHDRITALGADVDGAVRRISTSYTASGQLKSVASWNDAVVGSGTVVNETRYEYDANGLLAKEYQNPTGAVDVNTPYVGYVYDTAQSGGCFVNKLRLSSVFYPSGAVVNYEYGAEGSLDALLNRVASVRSGAAAVVEYDYAGLNAPVRVEYPEPNVSLDYEAVGALDRFGRIANHAWKNAQNQDVVRIQHGYDRVGNRLYREDAAAAGMGRNFDELYAYDEMDQLVGITRGRLNAAKTAIQSGKNFAETFAFDAVGNWTNFHQDATGDGTFELNQTRTHNPANEILTVGSSSACVATEANGNMTKVPKPDAWGAAYSLAYDAWNRLTEVVDSASAAVAAQYEYDGQNRRVLKRTYADGALAETRKFYFSRNWQCLEEFRADAATPNVRYVWGLRYIDDLICRDRDATQSGQLTERLYSLADPNWNVAALVSRQGVPQERYLYAAFGKPSVFSGDFAAPRATSAYEWTRTFTGQVLDNETGLMLYRNRYYHTTLGRFVTRDPIGYESLDINLLRYILNNPTVFQDIRGLSIWDYLPFTGTIRVCSKVLTGSAEGMKVSDYDSVSRLTHEDCYGCGILPEEAITRCRKEINILFLGFLGNFLLPPLNALVVSMVSDLLVLWSGAALPAVVAVTADSMINATCLVGGAYRIAKNADTAKADKCSCP
jgi:RHS repeat-associated protein